MLWVKSGRLCHLDQCGNDKQGVLTYGTVCLLLNKGHSCYKTKENWREEVQICLRMHCGCHSECSQLGFLD